MNVVRTRTSTTEEWCLLKSTMQALPARQVILVLYAKELLYAMGLDLNNRLDHVTFPMKIT